MNYDLIYKIADNKIVKILEALIIVLGTNYYWIVQQSAFDLSLNVSELSMTPVLFLISLLLFWQLESKVHSNYLFFGKVVAGVILAMALNKLGFQNVEPVGFLVPSMQFWKSLGILSIIIWTVNVPVHIFGIKIIHWWKYFPGLLAAMFVGFFLVKPNLIEVNIIDWKFLLKNNLVDGLLLLLIVYELAHLNQQLNRHVNFSVNKIVGVAIFAVILTFFYITGISLDLVGDFSLFQSKTKFFVISTAALFTLIMYLLFLSARILGPKKTEKVINKKSVMWSWSAMLVLTLVVWIPYLILFLPGSLGYDGMNQLAEFFRIHAQDGTVFYPTNHHPWVSTILIGSLVKAGMIVFGSFKAGIATFSVIVVLFASVTTVALSRFVANMKGNYWGWGTWALASLLPIFPFWYLTVDKTGIFILFFAWFLMSFVKMLINPSEKRNYVLLTLFGLLVSLFRNDMLYVIFIVFVFLIVLDKKGRLFKLLTIGTIMLFTMGWNRYSVNQLDIVPSPTAEMLSVPIQQIARTYDENPKEFSKKEQTELKKVFNNHRMPLHVVMGKYSSGLSDPVKQEFVGSSWIWQYRLSPSDNLRQKQLEKQEKEETKGVRTLLKIWAANLLDNVETYFTAWISNVYHYVSPLGINHGQGYRLTWNGNTGDNPHFKSSLTKGYDYYLTGEQVDKYRKLDVLLHTSVLGLLLVSGTWGTLLMGLSAYYVVWFDKRKAGIVLLFIGMFAVNFLGPVDGGLRYVFPIILGMPVLIATLTKQDF